ncbi:MAG: ABC transporter substrate-binding protein [Planctomycetia bacterium]|nr:ABC transporter substrate-binding protein [Planctomycetia bacterium]
MNELKRKLKTALLYVIVLLVLGMALFYSTVPFLRKDGRSDGGIPALKETKVEKKYRYSVTMSPVGTVHFERVPERVMTGDANYNEMLVATRDAHKIVKTSYQTDEISAFYSQIPGFSSGLNWNVINGNVFDSTERLTFDKELLYHLQCDIHHLDPIQVMGWKGWSRNDVEEIITNVGPFFANRGSRDFPLDRPKVAPYATAPPRQNPDAEQRKFQEEIEELPSYQNYEVYSLWELSDKIGQVYQKQEVVAKIKVVADRMSAEIQSKLPPKGKQPRVGLLYWRNKSFTPFGLHHGGFGQAQYQIVDARDAFEEIESYNNRSSKEPKTNVVGMVAAADLEALVACNPDIIIMARVGDVNGFKDLLKLKNDPLARTIPAFQNDRVYLGGAVFQGPIYFLFQVEMAAKQIYPEIFGPFREDQNYPKEEQLFSREELAQILREAESSTSETP